MMEKILVDRFIRYAMQHTTSDPNNHFCPSSSRQMDFSLILAAEMKLIGCEDVIVNHNGYLTATVPSNSQKKISTIGFIAHMDTSPDFNGNDVQPIIHSNFTGHPIVLKNNVIIDPAEFPEIKQYIGQDIITADGTTLLGADDKAGIAEIISAMEYLIRNPYTPHGKIRICFTPDEEIGRSADKFDLHEFDVDFAYTIDGGEIGELETENFNAALASIVVNGRSVHPGAAKNKMINASLVANQLISMLPPQERPEHTEHYEGFYHLQKFAGNVEKAELEFLIRDHDRGKFELKKKLLNEIVDLLNLKYEREVVKIGIADQYFNMREKIEPVWHIVQLAEKAMLRAGINPKIKPIRGGTDGARLSYMGLPCPNLFTGGHNFHGPYEFIPVPSMKKAVEVIINISKLVTEPEI